MMTPSTSSHLYLSHLTSSHLFSPLLTSSHLFSPQHHFTSSISSTSSRLFSPLLASSHIFSLFLSFLTSSHFFFVVISNIGLLPIMKNCTYIHKFSESKLFIFLTFYILQRFIKKFLSFWIYVVVLHFIFLGFLFSGFNIFYVV